MATSLADGTKSGSATVTLVPSATTVTVSVSPGTASLGQGGTQQFTATVTGSSNTAVTWTVAPSVGTMSSSGLYTAPATITTQQNVSVTATSQADGTKFGSATVTLTPPAPAVTVSVSPGTASLGQGGTQQFTATVTGSSNTAVTWTLAPSVGTVSSSGLYTAPSTITTQQNVSVTATSQADGAKFGSATVTLTPPATSTAPPGAAGYWSFDAADISGSQAFDRSGNGLTGTISNASPDSGHLNGALRFTGASSYVAVPDNAGLRLAHDVTLTAWIKTTNNSQTQDFVSKYDFTGAESGYILQALPTGVLNLHVGGDNLASASRDAHDTRAINDGQWHHVAVVIAVGQNVSFCVDGALSSTQPLVTAASGNVTPLYLGTFPGTYNGLPFTGSLDEVRVYGRALSATDVAALAQ
jgi:hypothetical protein